MPTTTASFKTRIRRLLEQAGLHAPELRERVFDEFSKLPPSHRSAYLKDLRYSVKAVNAAEHYEPLERRLGSLTVFPHNLRIANKLKASYTARDVANWRHWLQDKGVFEFETHSVTGLISTTEAEENPEMRRQWTSDSVLVGFWQRTMAPKAWRRNLLVNAAFACGPESAGACRSAVDSPGWTRQKNRWGEIEDQNGMPHIFLPGTIRWPRNASAPNPQSIQVDRNWRNQKRLESQALLLHSLVENLRSGLNEEPGEMIPAGSFDKAFLKSQKRLRIILQAVSYLANFLLAANTDPKTNQIDCLGPTAGSWEERPYEGGMTWDTAITELAFISLRRLLFDSAPANRVWTNRLHSELKRLEFGKRLLDPSRLDGLIQSAHALVQKRIVRRLKANRPALQAMHRPSDTSLTFLAAFDYRLDPGPFRNTRLYLKLLDVLEADLLRPHGMLRYGPHLVKDSRGNPVELIDSYLGCGYWLPSSLREFLALGGKARSAPSAKQPPGSTDRGSLRSMVDRQEFVPKGTEAQWSLGVSATLQGLANLMISVTDPSALQGKEMSAKDFQLLERLNEKLDEYLNRNLALITGSGKQGEAAAKSNGRPVPKFGVMEAYESVPFPNGRQFLPGAHPLAWARAQLHDGLQRARQAKERWQSLIRHERLCG